MMKSARILRTFLIISPAECNTGRAAQFLMHRLQAKWNNKFIFREAFANTLTFDVCFHASDEINSGLINITRLLGASAKV